MHGARSSPASLASTLGADLLRASMLGAPLPRIVDRYEVSSLLGYGASGVVVRAHDTRLHRYVAIKLMPASAATDRMLIEARTLAQLRRPRHVVQVMEAGSGTLSSPSGSMNVMFVSMEFVEGETVRTWLAGATRSLVQIVTAFQCLADGLATAHARGIVHGDVKPENAIIGRDGVPMLVDFGFAAIVWTGERKLMRDEVVGTAPYLAPEARDGQIDCKSDVYALAVSMWEALTSVHPFGENAPQTNWYGKLKPLPKEGEVAKPLRKLLRKALHPKPARRPTAVQLRDQLEVFRKTLVGRFMRIFRRLMIVSAVTLVGFSGFVIGGYVEGVVEKVSKNMQKNPHHWKLPQ